MSDHLESALRELARDVRTPAAPPGLTDAVLDRIEEGRSGHPAARLRWALAAVVGLLLAGLALSPVGAKVAEWLDFGGVMVRDDEPGTHGTPTVPSEPPAATPTSATLRPLVPSLLGEPDGTSVGADGGVVSMSWGSEKGTIRIDQFDATLDPVFWKTAPDAVHVQVRGDDALWFPTPHEVVVTPEGGDPQTHPPRLAARTLVVQTAGLTVRIEGDVTRARAVRIAASLE
ncbi:hypothetical protein [Nocardioides caldifontis]|uniref:hypothetical protein n=1 Tax=Nocardioides caldifontis TaxID=2588938 RepID=UPI0011DF1B18|nr:hypothetical protein [Nocardioides caldifontis]